MTTDPRQLVEQVLVVIGAMTGTPLEIYGTDADLEEAARVALLSSLTPRLVEALVEALDERDELRLTLAAERAQRSEQVAMLDHLIAHVEDYGEDAASDSVYEDLLRLRSAMLAADAGTVKP